MEGLTEAHKKTIMNLVDAASKTVGVSEIKALEHLSEIYAAVKADLDSSKEASDE
jgi:hypothetical protein